jgi:hypothetical protein
VGQDRIKELQLRYIRLEQKLLLERVRQDGHQSSLRDMIPRDTLIRHFLTLVATAFGHQELFDFRPLDYSEISKTPLDPLKDIEVAKHFHDSDFYVPVSLRQGANQQGALITTDNLLEELISSARSGSANIVSSIVAGMGEGKTTFVSQFLYKNYAKLRQQRFVPVRVNLDTASAHQILTEDAFFKILSNAIIDAIRNNEIQSTTGQTLSLTVSDNTLTDGARRSFAELVQKAQKLYDINFLINIDNIDYMFHLFDRGSFSEFRHDEYNHALLQLTNIVRWFLNDGDSVGRLGISVVFCIRYDTEAFFRAKSKEVPDYISKFKTFNISVPNNSQNPSTGATPAPYVNLYEHMRNIVKKRFQLLHQMIGALATNNTGELNFDPAALRKRVLSAEATIEVQSVESNRVIYDLWRLGRRGLRDVCDAISDYSLVFSKSNVDDALEIDATVADRFWKHYSPTVLSYCLSGKLLYSQFVGEVPNLFLINNITPLADGGVPQEMRQPTFCSFWLKFLILRFISVSRDRRLLADDVVKMFSGGNGQAYSPALVRLVLGSLAQLPLSDCIDVKIGLDGGGGGSDGYVRNLLLTSRGQYLVDSPSPFAFTFTYLQLMIDDHRLRLPSGIVEVFRYNSDIDYRYLVFEQRDYSLGNARMLVHKINQVIYFSLLLEEYLIVEKRLFPKVFERLQRMAVPIPESSDIVNNVLRDLKAITRRTTDPLKAFQDIERPETLARLRSEVVNYLNPIVENHRKYLEEAYGANGGV